MYFEKVQRGIQKRERRCNPRFPNSISCEGWEAIHRRRPDGELISSVMFQLFCHMNGMKG